MPDSGSGPVVSEAMNRKPPFIENSDEGIPLMFTESHVRVATPEESILWERLQAALSVDRERDRLVEENERLRTALEFYAHRNRYQTDDGRRAREALSSSPTEER